LHDGAEAAGARLALDRLLGDGDHGVGVDAELDALHLEKALILLDQGVLGLGEDADQRRLVEVVESGEHRQAADELRDEAELQEVLRLNLAEEVALAAILGPSDAPREADRGLAPAVGD